MPAPTDLPSPAPPPRRAPDSPAGSGTRPTAGPSTASSAFTSHSADEAEDLTADVFLRAVRAAERFDPARGIGQNLAAPDRPERAARSPAPRAPPAARAARRPAGSPSDAPSPEERLLWEEEVGRLLAPWPGWAPATGRSSGSATGAGSTPARSRRSSGSQKRPRARGSGARSPAARGAGVVSELPDDLRDLDRALRAVRFEPRASLGPEIVGRAVRGERRPPSDPHIGPWPGRARARRCRGARGRPRGGLAGIGRTPPWRAGHHRPLLL